MLLRLDLHLVREDLAQLQSFISHSQETVRVLSSDVGHWSVDVDAAHTFLSSCCIAPTALQVFCA